MNYKRMQVDVDIYLEDFSDRELVDELQERGYVVGKETLLTKQQERLFHELYLDYVDGKNTDKAVKKILDELYMYVPLRSV